MKPSRLIIVNVLMALIALMAFGACLTTGAADIPAHAVADILAGNGDQLPEAWSYIVTETRLPAAVTALLCGAALSVAGLLMQTTFANPLAGPSILGISTGASLGVAIVMLASGAAIVGSQAAVLTGALIGAFGVMMLLMSMSALVRSNTMLLIVGILIGYLASSVIALLNFFASGDSVHSYVIWGLGSFNGVTSAQLPLFAAAVVMATACSMLYGKSLNALLLGERYADSVGVNVRRTRHGLLILSGVLTAAATAWCGPIGFIGLVVPHIARLALRSSDHRALLPTTVITGMAVSLVCLWISISPGARGIIPINAVTPVIGVPVIIYIIVRRRTIAYFN